MMTRSTLAMLAILALCAGLSLACDRGRQTDCPEPTATTPSTATAQPRATTDPTLAADPTAGHGPGDGATAFTIYEAFLSPAQEPGEESEAPKAAKDLASTAPATERAQRPSRGYGQLRFARDLSKVTVEVQMQGVQAEDIVMFHIHCGPPGVLGPIIVDIGEVTNLQQDFADGRQVFELDNDDIVFVEHPPHGLKPRLPEGCPVDKGFLNQAKTVGSLEYLARQGVLYFNLHTKAHTFYGEMRGQIYAAPTP